MKKTENYNLNLPETIDNYSVEHSNDNMSIIDAKLKEHATEMDETQAEMDEVQTAINGVQTELGGVHTELDGVQAEIDVVQSTLTSAQTELSSVHTELTSVQTELASVQTALETLSGEEEEVETGAKINLDTILSNTDTNISLTGFIRGEEAHLSVAGYVGRNTAQNSIHIVKIMDDAEYAKFFQQFNVNASVPYNASTGGFRQATVSILMGENVVNEHIFKEKSTGKIVTTFDISEYISNDAYEWNGSNTFNGIEIFFQNMPDETMATYPLCINASSSCLWEGE